MNSEYMYMIGQKMPNYGPLQKLKEKHFQNELTQEYKKAIEQITNEQKLVERLDFLQLDKENSVENINRKIRNINITNSPKNSPKKSPKNSPKKSFKYKPKNSPVKKRSHSRSKSPKRSYKHSHKRSPKRSPK